MREPTGPPLCPHCGEVVDLPREDWQGGPVLHAECLPAWRAGIFDREPGGRVFSYPEGQAGPLSPQDR
jgi:hypothetical protein